LLPATDPFEWRWVGKPWAVAGPSDSSRYAAWVRPTVTLEDRGLRAAAIAFLSDFHSHWPVARKLGDFFESDGYTSLDQVLWLHRDRPWEDWWLLTSSCDVGHAGRALTRREIRTRDGLLVATMAQEAMIPGAALAGTQAGGGRTAGVSGAHATRSAVKR
jgi:acyl-CoA thioesterase